LIASGAENNDILYPTFGSGYWDANWPASTYFPTNKSNVERGLGHLRFDDLEVFWVDPPTDLEAQLGSPDIVHSNYFFCPTKLSRARLVYTPHDLAFLEQPEWTSKENWHTCINGVFDASVHADHVIAVSRHTRERFLETFPHYSAERVSVVYESSRFLGRPAVHQPDQLQYLRPGRLAVRWYK
jgi:hypothetical protein